MVLMSMVPENLMYVLYGYAGKLFQIRMLALFV